MEGEKVMKVVKVVALIIVVWNIFAAGSAIVLDKVDPYYAVQQKENELTVDELNAVCPDAFVSEADKKLLLSVLNDAAVIARIGTRSGIFAASIVGFLSIVFNISAIARSPCDEL